MDIETTGLEPKYDNIIEIAGIQYADGKEVGRFQSLVQPPLTEEYGGDDDEDENEDYDDDEPTETYYVPPFITELTGITNEMLADAPQTPEVIKKFADFLGDSVIVGYNVGFDVNFLYDNFMEHLGHPLENDFINIMRMARKLHPELEHHRLSDMVEYYKLTNEGAHRALADCLATQGCYEKMHDEAIEKFADEEAFIASFKRKSYGHNVRAGDIKGDEAKNNVDSPLYNRHCVFTGKLERFTRERAMQIVADIGGINDNTVTQKTNYLVLGNTDYRTSLRGGKSTKHKKAERYKAQGKDIEIIPESVFYDMISEEE